MRGQFVISLDFELHWGSRDASPFLDHRDAILNGRQAVEALVKLFRARSIHATWATVGILFARTREEALRHAPTRRPAYVDARLNPYDELLASGEDENRDPFHFAGPLVDLIAHTPLQELATHTFSHYYCLEPGQSAAAFAADLTAARTIGERHGRVLNSLVFPRNQFSTESLAVAREAGVTTFRGNPDAWCWQPGSGQQQTAARRALRLYDAYALAEPRLQHVLRDPSGLFNVPASRFLRPYHPKLAPADPLRLARIHAEMTAAARRGSLFHLWWHPNNFSSHLAQNLSFLERVLDHFELMQRRYAMESMTMAEAAAASDRV